MTDHREHQTKPAQRTEAVERNNEPISALADGELDPEGADFLIRRLADDKQMHQHWQRFHMVRACLQREFAGPVALVERVHAALEDEAKPVVNQGFSKLLRFGLGGAVAAGIAVVAVVGLADRMSSENDYGPQQTESPGFVSQPTALDRQFNAQAVPAGFDGKPDSATNDPSSRRVQQRINRYMIRHSQAAGGNGFNSLTPVLTGSSSVQLGRRSQQPTGEEGQDASNP